MLIHYSFQFTEENRAINQNLLKRLGKKMIKRIWTFKRITLAIITFMCTIIVAISLQKSIMGTDKLQRDFGVAFLFIVVLICFLYFLYKLLIPKSFRCMTVVKKYLSFRELKDRINNESFSSATVRSSIGKVIISPSFSKR